MLSPCPGCHTPPFQHQSSLWHLLALLRPETTVVALETAVIFEHQNYVISSMTASPCLALGMSLLLLGTEAFVTVNNQISKCNKAVLWIMLESGQLKSKAAITAVASSTFCSQICNWKQRRFLTVFCSHFDRLWAQKNKAVRGVIATF